MWDTIEICVATIEHNAREFRPVTMYPLRSIVCPEQTGSSA